MRENIKGMWFLKQATEKYCEYSKEISEEFEKKYKTERNDILFTVEPIDLKDLKITIWLPDVSDIYSTISAEPNFWLNENEYLEVLDLVCKKFLLSLTEEENIKLNKLLEEFELITDVEKAELINNSVINEKYISLQQAAKLYDKADSTLRRNCISGCFKDYSYKEGKVWYIEKEALEKQYNKKE